jgi:hypothetical protein
MIIDSTMIKYLENIGWRFVGDTYLKIVDGHHVARKGDTTWDNDLSEVLEKIHNKNRSTFHD